MTRCVLQSLAEKYREAIQHLNTLLPHPVKRLHIIGGGSRNQLLNRLTANATGLPVLAGPVEATAMGNILVPAMAAGEVADINHLRSVVRQSVSPQVFMPA